MAMASTPAIAQFETLPPEPPYCEAGNSGEFQHGSLTLDGSTYCLNRGVSDRYVTPPDGWSPHIGKFNLVTAFFPLAPVNPGWPVPTNNPRVVFFYTPGDDSTYPEWREETVAHTMHATGSQVRLLRFGECSEPSLSCSYDVYAEVGSPGQIPDWFEIPFYIRGDTATSLATVYAGLGLIEDGNTAPKGYMGVVGSSDDELSYLAVTTATDAENDPITSFVYKWGDGTTTTHKLDSATHTYLSPASGPIAVYFTDARGAAGTATFDPRTMLATETSGPHVVQVGDPISIEVGLRNVGMGALNVGYKYFYKVAPASGTIQLVSQPSIFLNTTIERGETAHATYVFNALKAGTFTFSFGGVGRLVSCPACASQTTYGGDHEIVIQDGPAPPPPPDTIFADDFETGDPDAWSAIVSDGGDLSVVDDAAMVGSKGLRASIDDRHPLFLVDRTPDAEKHYRLRFWVDPSAYVSTREPGRTRILRLGSASPGPHRGVVYLLIRRVAGIPQLIARNRHDDGSVESSAPVDLVDGPQAIEIEWRAASTDTADDGFLTVWIDGAPRVSLPEQDNSLFGIDGVRLGPTVLPRDTVGVLDFDDVVSRRSSYIGP